MSVRSIWTTNYDTLIEDTFRPSEIVVRVEDADISTVGLAVDQIELIKLHGCRVRSSPPGFVITRSDYEEFAERRPALTQRLCNDLLHKSFLFLGFSYSDPDIQTVMSQAQRLVGGDTREHYMIQRRVDPSDKELVSRQLLWIDELRRVGIRCALIDEHSELGPILEIIAKKSRGRTIYPTGSHVGSSALAKDVGVALSKVTPDVTLFNGQSQGIGREVIDAFVAESLKDRKDLRLRTRLFANPYSADPSMANDSSLIPTLLEWRSRLLRSCHVLLAFDGGMGTSAEVEAAFEAGCIVIPVPETTGGSADLLLNDPKFSGPINEFCPEYLLKARNHDVEAVDVMGCIAKALGQ